MTTTTTRTMTLRAIRRSADHYRLHVDGREVAWVNGNALGFRGFASSHEAIDAARSAYAALGPWLLRQRRVSTNSTRPFLLGVEPQGPTTWLTAGNVRIGRVAPWPVRDPAGGEGDPEYSFEFWLPPALGTALVLSAARRVHAAAARRAALLGDAGTYSPWPVATRREDPAEWFVTSG